MNKLIQKFKNHVIEISQNPNFIHHRWFIKYHLDIVERIALELCDVYKEADKDMIATLVWLHDYGKIVDYNNQYTTTLDAGRKKLLELGFPEDFVSRAISLVEIADKKLEINLNDAPIEVKIISSADGCSHLAGPFLNIFWHEATEKTFINKTFEELMEISSKKIKKDWDHKIVLPEARKCFEARYKFLLEQYGRLPDKFLC